MTSNSEAAFVHFFASQSGIKQCCFSLATQLSAEPAVEADMADAEAAASRPTSAPATGTEDVPEQPQEMELDSQEAAPAPELAEFALPPAIAEPPEQPCSEQLQVLCTADSC